MRNYITKINDRNLQRKKASGITSYVLYSFLILIILKLVNLIPTISLETDIWNFIRILMYSFNFSLAIFYILISFRFSIGNSSSLRVLKYSKNSKSYFNDILTMLILLIPAVPVYVLAWHYNSNDITFSLFHKFLIGLNSINILFFLLIYIKVDKGTYSIFKGTDTSKNNIMSAIFLTISLIIIVFSIFSLLNLDTKLFKLDTFIFGVLFFLTFVVLEQIISGFSDDIFAKDLENLEYEIYVKDLSDNQIRHILQNKYMGFLITDWIDNKNIEIELELQSIKEIQKNQKIKRTELSSIDKIEYPFEYQERLKIIENEELNLKTKRSTFFKENIKEIYEIIYKDKTIEKSDLEKLNELKLKLKKI